MAEWLAKVTPWRRSSPQRSPRRNVEALVPDAGHTKSALPQTFPTRFNVEARWPQAAPPPPRPATHRPRAKNRKPEFREAGNAPLLGTFTKKQRVSPRCSTLLWADRIGKAVAHEAFLHASRVEPLRRSVSWQGRSKLMGRSVEIRFLG